MAHPLKRRPALNARVWTAFIALTFIWGASFLWIKVAVEDMGAYSLVAFRIVFGVIGLVPFLLIKKPAMPRGRTTWIALIFLGLTSSSAPWLLISWAEETIDSALATVLNSMVPLFTILIAHFTLHDDRITRNRLIGLLIGFLGVVTLSQRGGGDGLSWFGSRAHLAGQLAMLGAAFLYAVSGIIARRYLRHLTALVQAFWSMLIGAAALWISLPVLGVSLQVSRNPVTWMGVVWLGILGAGIASMLFYFMLHAIGPTRASLVTYSIPVVGVSLGVLVLGEPLDMFLVSGMILIVAGVSVVNRKSSRPHRSPDSTG